MSAGDQHLAWTTVRRAELRRRFRRVHVPLAALVIAVATVATVVVARPGSEVRAVGTAAPKAAVDATPPPVTFVPTPVPSRVPRIVAGRPADARTAGSAISEPRATNGYIQIPSIGASAKIVAVGLDSNGLMVTPRNARDVAWLDNGTFPGPTRNALMGGHRNWKGVDGTFLKLERVSPGDVVTVGMNSRVYTFAVSWVRFYDPANAPLDELLGPAQVDSLTLVTCGGRFDKSSGHYEKRVVARAELVSVA